MQSMPASKTYRLLEAGPIVLVTTAWEGKPNIMTMGFHMMIQHAPPLVGSIIGPWDHSYQALRGTGECVIAIPTIDLAPKVVDIGSCSGEEIDKFGKFGLTPLAAEAVSAPLVTECLANIECRVAAERKERRTLHHWATEPSQLMAKPSIYASAWSAGGISRTDPAADRSIISSLWIELIRLFREAAGCQLSGHQGASSRRTAAKGMVPCPNLMPSLSLSPSPPMPVS